MEMRSRLDALFYGGNIYANGDFRRKAEALGVADGKVQAVGGREELEKLAGAETVRRDLKGKSLLPGFLDPHIHFCLGSLMPLMADCRTPPVQSVKEIVDNMRCQAEGSDPGGWVVGWGYDENLLKEGRHPSRAELDEACPYNPAILMHLSLHQCVVNSVALEYCGLDRFSQDPPGGRVGRSLSGRPTGFLQEKAAMVPFEVARRDLVSRAGEDLDRLLWENVSRLLRFGVVRVADAAMRPQEEVLWNSFITRHDVPLVVDRMEVGPEDMMAPAGRKSPVCPRAPPR